MVNKTYRALYFSCRKHQSRPKFSFKIPLNLTRLRKVLQIQEQTLPALAAENREAPQTPSRLSNSSSQEEEAFLLVALFLHSQQQALWSSFISAVSTDCSLVEGSSSTEECFSALRA